MAFIRVFLKTLGFLFGILIFVIFVNVLIYILPKEDTEITFLEGNEQSNNIIAILELNGPIINNSNQLLSKGLIEYVDPDEVSKKLNKLEKSNPKILILNINSPGGTVSATASLEKIILDFKKRNDLKIYVYSNEILASGGYWIATVGDKIFANYGSIIGSIGVSGPSWYYYNKPISISSGFFGKNIETKNGIEVFNQNAGYSKDLYNPFRKPTNEELKHLENIVLEIYNDFIFKVSKSRKIEINTIRNSIGGLIYTSKQAKENFLLDDVLYFDDLITQIVKEENFETYKVIKIKNNISYINDYILKLIFKDSNLFCNKFNSNFVSVIPIFLNQC